MIKYLVFVLFVFSFGTINAFGQEATIERESLSLEISPTSEKREYIVGEPWVCEFKASVTASKYREIDLRAWKRFFAVYEVLEGYHGSLKDTTLSDLLAAGNLDGKILRDRVPVVNWNVPDGEVFSKTEKTKLTAGEVVTTTFKHDFGSAIKAGKFKRKLWFAVVVEPEPNQYMLLFSREPTELEFVVRGDEMDSNKFAIQYREWKKSKDFTLHDEQELFDK